MYSKTTRLSNCGGQFQLQKLHPFKKLDSYLKINGVTALQELKLLITMVDNGGGQIDGLIQKGMSTLENDIRCLVPPARLRHPCHSNNQPGDFNLLYAKDLNDTLKLHGFEREMMNYDRLTRKLAINITLRMSPA